MTRFLHTFLALVLLAALLAAGCSSDKGKDTRPTTPNEEPPSKIRQVMKKMNDPKQGLLPAVGAELAADEPPWDKLGGQARDLVRMSDDLGQNDPPKGSKESWQQQTKALADLAAELDRAVQSRDRDKAKTAQENMTRSCKACHREHKP
jgi:hypothetical protein